MAYCGQCGSPLGVEERFCGACGASAAAVPAVASAAAPADVPYIPATEKSVGARSGRTKLIAVVGIVLAGVVARQAFTPGGAGGAGFMNVAGEVIDAASVPRGEPTQRWAYEPPRGATATRVAADASRIYVVVTDDGEDEIIALDRSDGEEVWSSTLRRAGTDAQVTASGGRVYVLEPSVGADAEDGGIEAFNAKNGDHLWDYDLPGPSRPYLTVAGSALVVGGGGSVAVLAASSGEERWTQDATDVDVVGNLVLAASPGELRALELGNGDERWSVTLPDEESANFAVIDGHPVALDGRRVTAFDPATGEELWSVSSPVDGPYYLTPADHSHLIVVGEQDLAVLDGKGKAVWDRSASDFNLAFRTGSSSHLLFRGDDTVTVRSAAEGDVEGRLNPSREGLAGGFGTHYAGDSLLAVSSRRAEVSAYSLPALDKRWAVRVRGADTIQAAIAVDDAVVIVDDTNRILYFS